MDGADDLPLRDGVVTGAGDDVTVGALLDDVDGRGDLRAGDDRGGDRCGCGEDGDNRGDEGGDAAGRQGGLTGGGDGTAGVYEGSFRETWT
ncbi:hypothetical protein GCM10028787_03780 [Brachybacterium horti]